MPNPTDRLKLPNPEPGSFDWHDAWYDMTSKLDANPGVAVVNGQFPAETWEGRLVFDLSSKLLYVYFDGEWHELSAAGG